MCVCVYYPDTSYSREKMEPQEQKKMMWGLEDQVRIIKNVLMVLLIIIEMSQHRRNGIQSSFFKKQVSGCFLVLLSYSSTFKLLYFY